MLYHLLNLLYDENIFKIRPLPCYNCVWTKIGIFNKSISSLSEIPSPSPMHLDSEGITLQIFNINFYNPLVPIINCFFWYTWIILDYIPTVWFQQLYLIFTNLRRRKDDRYFKVRLFCFSASFIGILIKSMDLDVFKLRPVWFLIALSMALIMMHKDRVDKRG